MSAQAVLSMIASVLPATPAGSSTEGDASGFQGLLAAVLPTDGETVVTTNQAGAVDGRLAPPPVAPSLVNAPAMPVHAEAPAPPDAVASDPDLTAEPDVAPETSQDRDVQPEILADIELAKEPEAQVPPASPDSKDLEAQILPGATPVTDSGALPDPRAVKDSGPRVLPDTAPVKNDSEPRTPPDGLTTREPGPQLLAAAPGGKEPRPQERPGSATGDVAAPDATGGDATEFASPGSSERPRPGAPTPAPSAQPMPPPLRALAERTSRPLDEAGAAPSSSTPDPKVAGPTVSPASPQAESPAKASAQAAPAAAAPQGDAAARTPDEPLSADGRVMSPAEAAAPARDHSLPTLSRAAIDATAQIAAQILRKLEGRSTRFEIALRPDELGRVDVKLDIDAEGRLAARLAFDNPAAATDLRGRADELRRQLESAGFQLADDAFEFADRDNGSSAFDRGQDTRHGQNRAFAAAARLRTEIDIGQPPQWLALSLSPSGVDIKV